MLSVKALIVTAVLGGGAFAAAGCHDDHDHRHRRYSLDRGHDHWRDDHHYRHRDRYHGRHEYHGDYHDHHREYGYRGGGGHRH